MPIGGCAAAPHLVAMPPMTRRTALSASLATAVLPAMASAQPAPALLSPSREPPVTDRPLVGATAWTLPNGLRVVLAESRRVPVAAHYLFYGAGGGEDPAGRSGLAHFLEHMMFKGSANVAPGAFSQVVAREGGQDNAFTSRDVTAYHQTVEASRLPLVMRMEADRFAAPLFPSETVEPERAVVLEERRQRTDSNPRARFIEAFDAAMWGPQHWRGRPIIGWEPEIRAITRTDMLQFFARRYAPGNAVLVVAGDVREAELRRLAEDLYGVVEARPFAARDRAAPPAAVVQPRLEVREPAVREALVLRSFMAPSLTFGDADRAWALEVVAHLLGSGPGSRLFRALVETGLATSAGASYDGETAGVATFSVSATLRPGVTPERLEAALDATLDALLQQGPTEAERARSLRQITAGALLTLDSIGGVPRLLGGALSLGLPLETVEFWPRRLQAVTLEQMTAAARAVLGEAPRTTGWLLPGAPA